MPSIALIGDYNKQVVAHAAIPSALELARKSLDVDISWTWIETKTICNDTVRSFDEFSAIWVVPGSSYANMEGAIKAVQFARETSRPFLGTCGGFQHALIEYARNVCDIDDADHVESNPEGATHIITPLLCSLVGQSGQIFLTPGSRLYSIFKGQSITEGYHCNYGLNPKWKSRFESRGLCFTGFDVAGEVRGFELPTHPFFIGTLFQPERSALRGKQHPLIKAFVEAISMS